jgi:hypothetical protein
MKTWFTKDRPFTIRIEKRRHSMTNRDKAINRAQEMIKAVTDLKDKAALELAVDIVDLTLPVPALSPAEVGGHTRCQC